MNKMDMVMQKPKEKSWIRYIKSRIANNKNFLGFVGGPTGSGKSWCSLRIGEELDPEFNIDRVVFNGVELMTLINSGKLGSGSVIVFEEAGVEMSAKNWQSIVNKMLNYLIQTFRHKRFILIFNSPYMDFVDASTRKLFHAEMTTVSIDKKKSQVKLKPQLSQYNSKYKKFYWKYLRVVTKDGVLPVRIWSVDRPSELLLKQYEQKKTEFTSKLNKNILEELKNHKKKKEKFTCKKCGYAWYTRIDVPTVCPECRKNPY